MTYFATFKCVNRTLLKLGSKNSTISIATLAKQDYHGIAMDTISVSLLHMVAEAGGVRAGGDADRKKRLDDLVTEGYLSKELPRFQLPDSPPAEATYRLTANGKQLLESEVAKP